MPSTSIANLPLVSILLLSHSSSAIIGDPTELLSKATSVQISPNDTWSCVPPSSPGSLSCAFDGNSSTRWTLNPGQRAAMITVDLDPGVIIDHFEVSFDESSVNPSFVVMTLFGNDVTWTTYMYNKSCQSCERRLRKSGSLYYSCTPAGSFWNVSVPLGLFSVRNGSDGWLWWRTFNRLQLAIQANDADYINQTKNSSIAIADIGLYGWNQPMNVCYYCYPADVVNASVLCHSNGTCQCKPGIDPDQCFPLSHHINSTIPECDASDTATCCPIGLHVAELNISMDIDNNCKNGQFADNTSVIFLNMNFQITAWKEDPMIYNVYNGRKSFQVQGSDFTKFISKEDYRVTVGDVQCEITSVSKNVIVFYPPNSSNFVTVNDPKKTILYVGCSAYVFPVGYIQYYLNWIDNPVNRNGLIIGLVCGVGGVIIIILAIVPYRAYMYCKSKRASPPGPSRMIHYHLQEARCSTSRGPQRDPSLLDGLSSEQKLMVEEVVVPYSRIQLVDEIGSGNFGKVYRGLFFKTKDDTEEVAIKTILTDSFVEWQEKVSFLQEAMLMKDLSHRNVLSLVAVVIENNFLYVVLPLMENGDLRGFVSKPEKVRNSISDHEF